MGNLTILYGNADSERKCAAWMAECIGRWGLAADSQHIDDTESPTDVALRLAILMLEHGRVIFTLSGQTPAPVLGHLATLLKLVNQPSLRPRLSPILTENRKLPPLHGWYIPVFTGDEHDVDALEHLVTGRRRRVPFPELW